MEICQNGITAEFETIKLISELNDSNPTDSQMPRQERYQILKPISRILCNSIVFDETNIANESFVSGFKTDTQEKQLKMVTSEEKTGTIEPECLLNEDTIPNLNNIDLKNVDLNKFKEFIEKNRLPIPKRQRIRRKKTYKYECDICCKKFPYPGELKSHQRSHTGEKPYTCDECNKTFKEIRCLELHKRVHDGVKPYTCDICSKVFTRKDILNVHKRTHTGETPYICDLCNKGFSQGSALIRHKRTHTGEMPYACDMCKKGFTQSSGLIKHKRVHAGETPFICDVCHVGFTLHKHLARHKRVHIEDGSAYVITLDQVTTELNRVIK